MNNNTTTIWVLVVDDDPDIIDALRAYFSSTRDIRVVGEAKNGVEALMLLENTHADIVLADIHMPKMDGVKLLHEIRERENPPIFMAMTALDTDETMLEVLAGGGAGYIVKSARPQNIIDAVRDAATGGTIVSPVALKRLVGHLPHGKAAAKSQSLQPPLKDITLTATQKRVLWHLCDGKSNAQIAEALSVSESTVKKQVSNLIASFGVTSRLSLAVAVMRAGDIYL